MGAPPAPRPQNGQGALLKAAGVAAALVALGAGSFFVVNALSKNDDAPQTPTPQIASTSAAPSTAPAPSAVASTGSSAGPSQSAGSASTSSASGSGEGAAVAQLDAWASEGRSSTTISEDSWGARLSSKWVGATDADAGHPQPYTAEEIKSEMEGLRTTYGSDLRILKLNDAGLQNAAIKGRNGWMAVVVNSDTSSEDKARTWCSAHFGGDITKCGEQHLNAPHDH